MARQFHAHALPKAASHEMISSGFGEHSVKTPKPYRFADFYPGTHPATMRVDGNQAPDSTQPRIRPWSHHGAEVSSKGKKRTGQCLSSTVTREKCIVCHPAVGHDLRPQQASNRAASSNLNRADLHTITEENHPRRQRESPQFHSFAGLVNGLFINRHAPQIVTNW